MRINYLLSTGICLFVRTVYSQQADFLAVNTSSGTYRGFSPYPSVHAYYGIPFAAPPIGDLRFAPPQPYHPSDWSIKDATQIRPACFQTLHTNAFLDKNSGVSESEDCLTLNVWAPAEKKGKALPVLIFLYGGAFTEGSAGLQQYSGIPFVSEQEDIIMITINYRLNIFGFPNSPAIMVKNPGLLDQRLAIEWLRDNIHSFGGDPKRMSMMGHSAGSISIAYYSYTYEHDPIVTGLIEISGSPGLIPTDDGKSWPTVANRTGCSNSDASEELACMRKVAPRYLKTNISADNLVPLDGASIVGGVPVIDNITMLAPEEYTARGKAGRFARLPLLASTTTHEADGGLPFSPTLGVNLTLSSQTTTFGFHCPVAATTSYWVTNKVPVWRYLHDGVFPELTPYPWMRSYHGSDLAIFFRNERLYAWQEVGPEVVKAGEYLRAAVASFVRDPERGLEAFGWPRYTGGDGTLVRLFGEDVASVAFEDPGAYDAVCASV